LETIIALSEEVPYLPILQLCPDVPHVDDERLVIATIATLVEASRYDCPYASKQILLGNPNI
jgi:hypothetical protein